MCPDRQILSVYFDNELHSPWKEKLEAHLEQCPECRARLEGYRFIREPVTGPLGPGELAAHIETARERLWQKIGPLAAQKCRPRLWSRSIAVPVPLAAAAALIMVIAFAAVLAGRPSPGAVPDSQMAAAGLGVDVQGIIPISDMNGILQYLGNENAADMVIIRLPESKSFISTGEPTIIRASDYSRRNEPR
jgi:anti-sigma factor RsiW